MNSTFSNILIIALLSISSVVSAADHSRSCSRLQASGNAEYPPYLWRSVDDPSRLTGAIAYMISDLAAALELDIDLIYSGPWGRVQVDMASGDLDLIAGAFFTVPRTKYMDYVYPQFQGTKTAVWINNSKPFVFHQWDDLKGHRGITVIHNSFGQEFDEFAKRNLSIAEVGSLDQGLGMLSAGRVDYLIYEENPGLANAKRLGIDNITALATEVTHQDLFLTVSQKSPCNSLKLKADISAILQRFAEDKKMQSYLTKALAQWAAEQDT